MNVLNCFSREDLRSYLLGKLSEEKSSEVSNHLQTCHECEETVVGLDESADSLVALIKDPAAEFNPYETDPEFQRAMAAAQLAGSASRDLDNSKDVGSLHRVGDYEIVQPLAAGGMGTVYRARHLRLSRDVALKILPSNKMQNSDAIMRFQREMQIVGQMSHRSMVAATDAGEHAGTHYLAMELIDGLDLGKIVRTLGPLSVADACQLVKEAAIALEYAHEQGVIHRDVKPSNLMLDRQGNVKVLDLGLATLGGLTGTVDELTTIGQLMGTLDYMAPEQCGEGERIDRRADVYGIGATLYKLLSAAAPYSLPDRDTPLKKLRAMAVEPPVPISDRISGIPVKLAEVIGHSLERKMESRIATAGTLAELLEPWTKESDLKSLIEKAVVRNEEISEPVNSDWESGIEIEKNGPPSTPKVRTKVVQELKATESSGKRGFWSIVKSIAMLSMLGGLVWASITIYLNTLQGQFVVVSEVDDVSVTLLKDASPATELKIQHGRDETKLYAGKYKVVINGDSDSLFVDVDEFQLKKGETVVARIFRKPLTKSGSKLAASPGDSSKNQRVERKDPEVAIMAQPRYQGRTIEEYIDASLTNRRRRSLTKGILRTLSMKSSEQELKRILDKRIDAISTELDPGILRRHVEMLVPICVNEKLENQLFKTAILRDAALREDWSFLNSWNPVDVSDSGNSIHLEIDPSSIESSSLFQSFGYSPERQNKALFEIFQEIGSPKVKAVCMAWAYSESTRNKKTISSRIWQPMVMKSMDSKDPDLQQIAVRFAYRFYREGATGFGTKLSLLKTASNSKVAAIALRWQCNELIKGRITEGAVPRLPSLVAGQVSQGNLYPERLVELIPFHSGAFPEIRKLIQSSRNKEDQKNKFFISQFDPIQYFRESGVQEIDGQEYELFAHDLNPKTKRVPRRLLSQEQPASEGRSTLGALVGGGAVGGNMVGSLGSSGGAPRHFDLFYAVGVYQKAVEACGLAIKKGILNPNQIKELADVLPSQEKSFVPASAEAIDIIHGIRTTEIDGHTLGYWQAVAYHAHNILSFQKGIQNSCKLMKENEGTTFLTDLFQYFQPKSGISRQNIAKSVGVAPFPWLLKDEFISKIDLSDALLVLHSRLELFPNHKERLVKLLRGIWKKCSENQKPKVLSLLLMLVPRSEPCPELGELVRAESLDSETEMALHQLDRCRSEWALELASRKINPKCSINVLVELLDNSEYYLPKKFRGEGGDTLEKKKYVDSLQKEIGKRIVFEILAKRVRLDIRRVFENYTLWDGFVSQKRGGQTVLIPSRSIWSYLDQVSSEESSKSSPIWKVLKNSPVTVSSLKTLAKTRNSSKRTNLFERLGIEQN